MSEGLFFSIEKYFFKKIIVKQGVKSLHNIKTKKKIKQKKKIIKDKDRQREKKKEKKEKNSPKFSQCQAAKLR